MTAIAGIFEFMDANGAVVEEVMASRSKSNTALSFYVMNRHGQSPKTTDAELIDVCLALFLYGSDAMKDKYGDPPA